MPFVAKIQREDPFRCRPIACSMAAGAAAPLNSSGGSIDVSDPRPFDKCAAKPVDGKMVVRPLEMLSTVGTNGSVLRWRRSR
jgi:hypothetical protein